MNTTRTAAELSPTKLALLKIQDLKQQLAEARQDKTGDIAIVSMACRFPRRSSTPEAFWQSLIDGADEVGEIPDDRWDVEAYFDENPDTPGKMYARKGVFLEHLDLMDPEFFGISPREATWIDPQQRLLLEVSWEALERAGWPSDRIGQDTGLFVGWMHNDYQNEASDSLLNLNPYIATGSAGSFLSGRLSYYLGLEGPSLAVDTACSSSLVALHLACQSLRRQECGRALVGGVNAIVSPTTNILTCKLKALSPAGHSRAFDAKADGYLRGEGCGIVALRRLADAERDGDPVLAVIRGSAIGHNGFSSGLTAPNPKAQERVIRDALQRAGVAPARVEYLEAHGTGTELGDPIEMRAAAAVLGEDRDPEQPLLVGSVKTNIGHLEAAAGMAGLIKVLLAFQHDSIPAQRNFEEPNPHIPWEQLAVKVLTEHSEWPSTGRRIAGVSAFGMSGTNAHVIIESPPLNGSSRTAPVVIQTPKDEEAPDQAAPDQAAPQLLVLSGKSDEALRDLAESYRRWLASDVDVNLADVSYTTGVGRRHFDRRAALVVDSSQQACELLEQLERSGSETGLFQGQRRTEPKVAWQFTGQGAQFVGMAKQLYQTQAAFRQAIDECDERLREWREGSLCEVLFEDANAIHHTHWTQPALFAVQMGLVRLLNSWGLSPDVVLGHSVGQYAAACVAGIMSWEDGLQLISERGRLIGELPSGGAMAAVFAPDVSDAITNGVAIAARNGSHTVISGPEESVDAVTQQFAERGVRIKRLTTSHAFHSSLMEPALAPFQQVADRVAFAPPQLPLICNVTGQPLSPSERLDGEYWRRHIREPVRYAESIAAVKELGCEVLLELGPQAILTRMAASVWGGSTNGLISCLSRDQPDRHAFLWAVAQMYAEGVTPDFAAMYEGQRRQRLILPTYPFQRRRYWGPAKPMSRQSGIHTQHPLLGGKKPLAGLPKETRFESWIAPDQPAWLQDHQVMQDIVMPGAAYVEIALAVEPSHDLQDLVFEQPLRAKQRTCLQTVARTDEQGRKTIEMYSLPEDGNHWTRHCSAVVAATREPQPGPVDRAVVAERCGHTAEVAEFYRMMESLGLDYGPQFQCIESLQFGEADVLARLQTTSDLRGFSLPPTLLDAAFHSLAVGLMRDSNAPLFLPVGIGRVQSFNAIDGPVWCHAEWNQSEGEVRTADLTLFDDNGQVAARFADLKLRELNRAALRQMSGGGVQRLLYELNWRPTRLPASNKKENRWLVVHQAKAASANSDDGDRPCLATAVREGLVANGQHLLSVELVEGLPGASEITDGAARLAGDQAEHWLDLLDQWRETEEVEAPQGVVWILSDSTSKVGASQARVPGVDLSDAQRHCSGLLALTAALGERDIRRLERGLQLVTREGVAMSLDADAESPVDLNPVQAQYWGLGRAIGAEKPQLRCRLVDAPMGTGEAFDEIATAVVDVLLNDTPENQIAIRDSQFLAPRLTSVKLPPRDEDAPSFTAAADGSYLITGGLGMLGRQAALWLAQRGAGCVVLVSRRPPSESTRELIEEIQASGCQVHVHQADLAQRTDVEQLFARFGDDLPPLHGVIHAAGVVDDGLLGDQTWERFEKVLAPKVRGAAMLHEFTASLPLDFFVLYSSAASILGNPGQSSYATANALLDGLAWHRRATGLPALSVNWGPWTEGMADNEMIVKRLALQGITPLTVSEAHEALERMILEEVVQATVLDVDWRRMRMGLGAEAPPLLQELTPVAGPSGSGNSELVAKLRKLQPPARKRLLVETIQGELQQILSTSEAPDPDTPLIEMGLDSLMAVEFSTRLQQQLGEEFAIAPTLLYDYPTVSSISDYLLELMTDLPDGAPAAEAPSVTGAKTIEDEVVIIGMGCRFPGASSLREFWDNLQNGVDSTRDVPADRWDVDQYYDPTPAPGKMYTRAGGFLDNIGDFDAEFFNISPQEACWTDPQHRLLLEVSWEALEDAGVSPHPVVDARVGVFIGIMSQDYGECLGANDVETIEGFQGAGLSHSAGVGRISYAFGFEGPSLAIDSASSSSLVAVCQAAKSLLDGDCNMALAGGVNAILTPTNTLLLSKVKMLSPDGRCKSFSAAADGFGRGEGCGVVVLKRRRDAERDGDRILAVIRGAAVSHNGFSGGITSPNGRAQERAIREALAAARMQPTEVQYLEAHGTGTELGDPIEIRAATTVLGKGRTSSNPLLMGSVKANIAHLEAAGGVSGLIKTVLAMQHGVLPRQLHFDEPSPHVPWDRAPLKVVQENTVWPEGDERIAGVTALGLTGTNAHVILSRPTPEADGAGEPSDGERSHHLMVLSARRAADLQPLAENYALALADDEAIDVADMCHTLAVGRRHFEHRATFVVSSSEQARELLQSLACGQADPRINRGQSRNEPKQAWFFGGADAQHPGCGRTLYETQPAFREVIDACDQALRENAHGSDAPSLRDRMWGEAEEEAPTSGSQVALFALQMGLARLWQAWGVEPDAVLGQGVGQYAAACVTGVIKIEDAVRLVAAREQLLANRDGGQQNGLPADDIAAALDQFEALADTVDYFPADRPMICELTGKVVPVHRLLGGSYWRRHCEESPVEVWAALSELDCEVVLEVGPRIPLESKLAEQGSKPAPACVASLTPEQDETASLLQALGELYVRGSAPDFVAFDRPWNRKRLGLPTYPFQRSRYWITDVAEHMANNNSKPGAAKS